MAYVSFKDCGVESKQISHVTTDKDRTLIWLVSGNAIETKESLELVNQRLYAASREI